MPGPRLVPERYKPFLLVTPETEGGESQTEGPPEQLRTYVKITNGEPYKSV